MSALFPSLPLLCLLYPTHNVPANGTFSVSRLSDSHEMFVRNNRDLCKGMKRERASSSKTDRKSLVGTIAVRGVNSGRSSNQSDASSSQSPDLSSRKRSLQMTAQHERDMLLASQDRVALAMKQKLYRMTNAVSGSIAARKKMKEDFFRGPSEPTFMMSVVDCDNNKISSVDQETSSVSLIPTFELREGYRNTSSSSLVANYPQVDMNLTYQNKSKNPPMYKDAPDIPLTTASSAIALRAVSNSNNMIRQNQRSPGQYFGEFEFGLPTSQCSYFRFSTNLAFTHSLFWRVQYPVPIFLLLVLQQWTVVLRYLGMIGNYHPLLTLPLV